MSDLKNLANGMKGLVQLTDLPENHPAYGKDHIEEMLDKVSSGEVTDEKAHRWVGWIQCAMCMGGAVTLEELKDFNRMILK